MYNVDSRRWGGPCKKRVIYPPGSSNVVPPSLGGTPVTCIAHKHRVISIRIAGENEVGFIIKAAVAFKAKAELVFIPFG